MVAHSTIQTNIYLANIDNAAAVYRLHATGGGHGARAPSGRGRPVMNGRDGGFTGT